jgi:glucokinase
MIPNADFLGRDFQSFGALEAVASGTAIVERSRHVLKGKKSKAELDRLVADDVFEAYRRKDAWASTIIKEMIDYLAVAIANTAISFDPEMIILGSGFSNSADLLVDPILDRIKNCIPNPPKLVVSKLGRRATVMGAITNVLHNTSNFYVVHKLS